MQTFQQGQQHWLSRFDSNHEQTRVLRPYRPWLAGLFSVMALGALYMAIAALVGSWRQAIALLQQDVVILVPFLIAFGIQVGVAVALQRRRF